MLNFSWSYSSSWHKAMLMHSRAYRIGRLHPRFTHVFISLSVSMRPAIVIQPIALCMAACRAEAYWRWLPIQVAQSIPLCLGHIGRTRSCQAPITYNQFHRHLRTALIRAADVPFCGASSRVRPDNSPASVKQQRRPFESRVWHAAISNKTPFGWMFAYTETHDR